MICRPEIFRLKFLHTVSSLQSASTFLLIGELAQLHQN
jgi:hypothetical protein